MEQVAQEMNVGLLSYSMTHHTRQSALGLPLISHKYFNGEEYAISEYTMSEIIASVYEVIEKSKMKEGILFLDEINCVSETLSPIMLQFLQYKVFGRHQVPNGWIVVTAGNPPEYNNSVREFDIVTWDRLKRIDIDPDYDAWKEYAMKVKVHPSVLSFLEVKKKYFYSIESTVEGKSFVTARGWDDLSHMIQLYESNNLVVDQHVVSQYIQNKKISKEFSIYYDLFNKYRSDYQIDQILAGTVSSEIKERAVKARFDERYALISLLLERLVDGMSDYFSQVEVLKVVNEVQKEMKKHTEQKVTLQKLLEQFINLQKKQLEQAKSANNINYNGQLQQVKTIKVLEHYSALVTTVLDKDECLKTFKKEYDTSMKKSKKEKEFILNQLNQLFLFIDEVFKDGQEIVIVMSELTTNYYTNKFIAFNGCDAYFKHNKDLLFYQRQIDIIKVLEEVEESE